MNIYTLYTQDIRLYIYSVVIDNRLSLREALRLCGCVARFQLNAELSAKSAQTGERTSYGAGIGIGVNVAVSIGNCLATAATTSAAAAATIATTQRWQLLHIIGTSASNLLDTQHVRCADKARVSRRGWREREREWGGGGKERENARQRAR